MTARRLITTTFARVMACALLAGSLLAQTRYLLETALSTDITRLSSQYGLTVVETVREAEGNIYVVTVPAASLAALETDSSVRWVRPDAEVNTVEQNLQLGPATALDPFVDALALHTPAQYFGATVRAGYVQQTATTLIELPQTQQQFPTGSGIVAVIDTGVDPTHPALA